MTSLQKFKELLDFIKYHIRNNPKKTLHDINPLLTELLRNIGEPSIKEKK